MRRLRARTPAAAAVDGDARVPRRLVGGGEKQARRKAWPPAPRLGGGATRGQLRHAGEEVARAGGCTKPGEKEDGPGGGASPGG